jgi:hypothetical protein
MIIGDERDLNLQIFFDNISTRVYPLRNLNQIEAFLETYHTIENAGAHK